MKKTLGILFAIIITCSVAKSQAWERIVTVSYDTSIENILSDLTQRYNLNFSFSKDMVPLERKITITIENKSISELLATIFARAGIQYEYIGNQIVLKTYEQSEKPTLLTGKVVDKLKQSPLPFASVRLDGTLTGTATNGEGEFVLQIPDAGQHNKITVSYIGYKSQSISITYPAQEVIVYLEEDTRELDPVVITSTTGLSVLEEAMGKITTNYDTNALIYTYFIRDITTQNGNPIRASEAMYQAYRGIDAVDNKIRFITGRRSKDYNSFQTILLSFPHWAGFEPAMGINTIFTSDLVTAKKEEGVLSRKFLEQHDFDLLGVSRLNDKDVYVVSYDQKDRYKNKSLWTGKFYIDTETLAFIRLEIELSPKGIKHAKFFGAPKAFAIIFGYSECSILGEKLVIDYNELNNKWYLSDVRLSADVNVTKTKRKLFSKINVTGELVITDVKKEDVKPFPQKEVITDRDWEYYYTNTNYRINTTTIPTDTGMEDAFREIKSNNIKNGFNTNFWRIWPPYKNHPELLRIDSIQSMADTEIYTNHSGQSDLPEFKTNHKLSRPRFAPLSESFSTTHFKLYFTPIDSTTAKEISQVLEANYSRVLNNFELQSLQEPVTVEIYPGIEDYHFAIGNTGAPESDAGMATGMNTFKIVSPRNPGSYHTRETILKAAVHEFAHCVHYNFIYQLNEKEHHEIIKKGEAFWLFEAMASYQAGQYYDPQRFEYLKKGYFPSLKELNHVNENGKIYDLGFVLIDFIQSTWGKQAVINLTKSNGDLQISLGLSETEFESQFYAHIKKKYLQLN